MSYNIVIRHLTGTQKGKDQVITAQEASLGTGPGNTVRLDAVWDKGVASSHARVFRDVNGGWILEDAGSRSGTFVNGQRVTTRMQVKGSIVVELGSGGPKMEIMLPPPLPAAGGAPGGRGAAGARSGGGAGKLVLVAAVLAILGVGAWLLAGKAGGDSDTRIQQAAKDHEQGIGLVVTAAEGETETVGTAWAVGPDMFATNAHVVVPVLRAMKEGSTAYVVINKRPDQRFRIKAAIPHPRYLTPEIGVNGKPPATNPWDVGVLIVEGHPSAILPLASKEKLQSIDSGHRIAFLGFPMEDIKNGGVDPQNPVATMQSGIVTAATDFWLARSVFENRRLIQHNLPAVGGASGSPIFDADGDVIGILSSGNIMMAVNPTQWANFINSIAEAKNQVVENAKKVVPSLATEDEKQKLVAELEATLRALDRTPLPAAAMKRAPSAALINYAQRIDMLQDLLAMVKEARASGKF